MLPLLLWLLTTPTKPLKSYEVAAKPAKVVDKMPVGLAYVVRFPEGTIVSCDPDYGLFVRPIVKDAYNYYYVAPGKEVHEDKENQYIVACLKVQ